MSYHRGGKKALLANGLQPAKRQVIICGRWKGANAKFRDLKMMVFKKSSSHSIWTENAPIRTKNHEAALSKMPFVVLSSLVRQVWPTLAY